MGERTKYASGVFSWIDLTTTDPDAAKGFYGELFGWGADALDGGPFPYLVIKTPDGRSNGGIRPQMEQEQVPYWLVYFGVEDAEASASKAEELGATKLAGPMSI